MIKLLRKNSSLPLLLLCLLVLFSCGGDSLLSDEELLGRWELLSAERDHRPTSSLDGLFFAFEENGQLTTNISGEEEVLSYTFEDNIIAQRGGAIDVDMEVTTFSTDTLLVLTKIQNFNFKFELVRQKTDS